MPSFVEISSLGGLIPGITQEDLSANISMPRNKLLAALMYRLGIIETWATGIDLIRSSYTDTDKTIEISITPNTFTLRLPNRNTSNAAPKSGSDKDEVLKAVLDECNTRAKIQQQTGFSQSKTINLLRELTDEGLLRRDGKSRNTRYVME